jgi:hypothetical protein
VEALRGFDEIQDNDPFRTNIDFLQFFRNSINHIYCDTRHVAGRLLPLMLKRSLYEAHAVAYAIARI